MPPPVPCRRLLAAAPALLASLALLAPGCGGDGGGGTTAPAGDSPYRGGEASIEGFGEEAEGAERAAILASFEGYLAALAAGERAAACSHLSATVEASLRQFAPPRLRGAGCPRLLGAVLAPTAAAIARQQAAGKVTRVRVEGDRGFVVFRAPGAALYQQTMVREGGEWKMSTVAAAVLVPDL